MNKGISVIGLILIAAAGVLTALSLSHEDVLKANKELCAKYTKDAQSALANNDIDKAFKFAKLAIKVDPGNKSGYKVLAQITDAKCKASMPAAAKPAANTQSAPAKAAPAQPAAKPAKPAEEEEMGC